MKAKKGFTLIELLVVIAIIALLSSVVLAALSTARMKARDARRIADLEQIKIALELYYDAKGYYPQAGCGWDCNGYRYSFDASWPFLASDTAPYIPKLPVDPINTACAVWTASNCLSYEYGNVGRTTNPATYDLFARLEVATNPLACPNTTYTYGKGAGMSLSLCASGNGLYDNSPQ
jgi:prepilin-type N-terminal cleavage/methylation domain-containing protein